MNSDRLAIACGLGLLWPIILSLLTARPQK